MGLSLPAVSKCLSTPEGCQERCGHSGGCGPAALRPPLHDRGWSLSATGTAWVLALGAFVVAAFAGRSVVLIIIAIIMIDVTFGDERFAA